MRAKKAIIYLNLCLKGGNCCYLSKSVIFIQSKQKFSKDRTLVKLTSLILSKYV